MNNLSGLLAVVRLKNEPASLSVSMVTIKRVLGLWVASDKSGCPSSEITRVEVDKKLETAGSLSLTNLNLHTVLECQVSVVFFFSIPFSK